MGDHCTKGSVGIHPLGREKFAVIWMWRKKDPFLNVIFDFYMNFDLYLW